MTFDLANARNSPAALNVARLVSQCLLLAVSEVREWPPFLVRYQNAVASHAARALIARRSHDALMDLRDNATYLSHAKERDGSSSPQTRRAVSTTSLSFRS